MLPVVLDLPKNSDRFATEPPLVVLPLLVSFSLELSEALPLFAPVA